MFALTRHNHGDTFGLPDFVSGVKVKRAPRVDVKKRDHFIPSIYEEVTPEMVVAIDKKEYEPRDLTQSLGNENTPVIKGTGLSTSFSDPHGNTINAPTVNLLEQVDASDNVKRFAQAHAWAQFNKNKLYTVF